MTLLHTTSRELLESVAGKAHELHSVAGYRKVAFQIVLHCSCGEVFRMPHSVVAIAALRFVPEVQ